MLVNDNAMYRVYEQDLERTTDFTKTVANIADGFYKAQMNTRIALVAMETWTSVDMVQVTGDILETLNNFLSYRSEYIVGHVDHDTAHLLSGRYFEGSASGKAIYNGMCSDTDSGGVSENMDSSNPSVLGALLAHEIGHNIGMQHDDERSCFCPDHFGCIMDSNMGLEPPVRFTSCSSVDYSNFLDSGLGHCLFNVPTRLLDSPLCGNGFVEDGEECDCGTSEECEDNQCCVDCLLAYHAVCNDGECCHNCQFMVAGSVCRGAVDECDITEVCTGRHHQCPVDVYRQDGSQCSDSEGNCGKSGSEWIACREEDVFCGYLLCDGQTNLPRIGTIDFMTSEVLYIDGQFLYCK
ncbi:disintegrin and metalloproteinase domain-containing protein 11-like [Saccoglossus kowalevskii]